MNAPVRLPTVQRIGPGRVRITGDINDSLRDWLRARREVVDVRERESVGAIEVRFHDDLDGAPRGTFARALDDHLHLMVRPVREPFGVAVVHALPGRVRLAVRGLSRDDDLARLARWVSERPGVLRAHASPAGGTIVVQFDPATLDAAALLDAVRTSDRARWPDDALPQPGSHALPMAFNTAVLAATVSGVLPPVAASVAVALTAIPTTRRAARALSQRRVSVDALDVAAVGVSIATGQPATGAFITWLLGVGDMLLARSADKARGAISRLMNLDTAEAWRVDGEHVVKVAADTLRVGDVIMVDTARAVPADGVVISGEASVDEKALTGESAPRFKGEGDVVLAATTVVEGQLRVRVERAGGDTTAARIVRILEGAGAKPMTLQRNAERVADRLVLPTFGLAGAAFMATGQVARATSVLITDFGSGIRIAVPTSALTAMTLAAREGVLVKGAQYLERLAQADVVVFDKTGTLTTGLPTVVHLGVRGTFTGDAVLGLAASAEQRQAHPLAHAIVRHAELMGVAVSEATLGSERCAVGRGLEARVDGRAVTVGSARWMRELGYDAALTDAEREAFARHHATPVYVAVDGELAGVMGLADAPRDESAAVVAALRANGRRRVVLLSGDASGPVEAVARAVGADEARGELLPQDKADFVRALQREGRVVAMVGDGVNDAPALALADVGISLRGGTDVALETADVVLLEGGLSRLPVAFDVGARAMASVRRGLGVVIAPNAVAIALGALGILSPAAAAAVNNGTTVAAALLAIAPLMRTTR